MSSQVIKIANCSGYYGDKLSAAKDMIDGHTYVGSYLALSVLTFIPVFFLFFYFNKKKKTNEKKTSGRSYLELLAQPRFCKP